jgi:glycosyltransferase involved in cell wall biosynthesis
MQGARPSVLIIGPTPPPYHGVAVATHNLLRARDVGQLVLLHLDISDRRGISHVDKPDLVDVLQFLRQWLRLAWTLSLRRPQVVYLSISQSTIGFARDALFMTLARLFRRRIVVHLHGGNLVTWYRQRGAAIRSLVRHVLSWSTRFIVLAERFREPLSSILPADRIVVVENGIPWSDMVRAGPAAAAGARRRVLALSTLSREKGTLLLLEAIARLVPRWRDTEFVIAGPWLRDTDRAEAAELVRQHGLEAYVQFPGQVDGAAKQMLFAAADLFVFPGIQQEGQPLVVLEAMAAGLPVVFADRGCLRETVVCGEAGIEFQVNDPQHLAAQIEWLLERPAEILRLGTAGRRRFEERYCEQRFVANMTRVFLETAGMPA